MVLLRAADQWFVMHDPAAEDQLAIVLGQRQLMAVCCMFLTVLGLVATLAYVAGRTITAAQFQSSESDRAETGHPMVVDPPRALEARAESLPERSTQAIPPAVPMTVAASPLPALVIPASRNTTPPAATASTPASSPVPVPAPAPAVSRPAPPAVAPAPVAAPVAVASRSDEPARGQSFWQVGLVDPGTAQAMVSRVAGMGLPARIAAGTSAQSRRVLVGPLGSQAETAAAKQALDARQMQAFLKIY